MKAQINAWFQLALSFLDQGMGVEVDEAAVARILVKEETFSRRLIRNFIFPPSFYLANYFKQNKTSQLNI